MNDFKECLKFSHEAEELPVWKQVYQTAFPSMVSMVSYRQDGFWQREGIDRGIILSNTKQVFVDEKVRGTNKRTGKVYPDIALEYLSNDRTGALGWVCKQLRADYIAYLIAPLGKCYMLPVIQMQQAWNIKGEEWKGKYTTRPAFNSGYSTWFCAVPVDVLFKEIGAALRIEFEAFDFLE